LVPIEGIQIRKRLKQQLRLISSHHLYSVFAISILFVFFIAVISALTSTVSANCIAPNYRGRQWPDIPVRQVCTQSGLVRSIDALILARHFRRGPGSRVNFPSSLTRSREYQRAKLPGDEAGHLVGSQFSGPPTAWNLSPQNRAVNRNAGSRFLISDWYGAEREVARYFETAGPNGQARWRVDLSYNDRAHPTRPSEFRLRVDFGRGGPSPLETRILNAPPQGAIRVPPRSQINRRRG